MNSLLQSYLSTTKSDSQEGVPAAPPGPTVLEKVAEVSEDEEELSNSPRPLTLQISEAKSTVHHKGVSDSSTDPSKAFRRSTAQQLFKQELQRRCESLIITSHKLLGDEKGEEEVVEEDERAVIQDQSSPSYTEMVDSRNVAVGQSSLAKSGSTRDSLPEQDETYDVLVTIKASQQRQEAESASVNYIIDTADDPEFPLAEDTDRQQDTPKESALASPSPEEPLSQTSPARETQVRSEPDCAIETRKTQKDGLGGGQLAGAEEGDRADR